MRLFNEFWERLELPTNGKTDPETWNLSTIEYVYQALLALEAGVPMAVIEGYKDGRVKFALSNVQFGWGKNTKNENGEEVFVLFS
jgi:hypothetical protein